MSTLKVDLCVIGGGAGGLSVASAAAQLGVRVALVEAEKMGGDCLNYGCVPSKTLLASAKVAQMCREAENFGLSIANPSVEIKLIMEHVKKVIDRISEHDSVKRFEGLGVHVIQAAAKFVDKNILLAGEALIYAKHFVIATGSSASIPPIPGLDTVSYFTNESIFDLSENPEHLVVIGGGPIGCELAQAFLMLGIRVSVLEMNKILPRDEAELVGILREHLLKQGLSLFEGIKILEISKQDTKIIIKIEQNGEQKQIMGSHLLVATGRKPNLEYLNLEKASVVYTPRGIGVDSRLRSSNKKIYAIGDAVGPYQFTHMASYHARIVIRNILFKLPAKVDYRVVPWVSYTEPELAHAGLSFEEAQKTDPKVKELTFSFDDNDRAQAEVATMGKIKIIVNRKGVVLGVNILGSHAGELLLPWIDLVSRRKSLKALMDLIVPYPTLSEISKQVSAEFYKPMLFSKKIRRLVKFLGWF